MFEQHNVGQKIVRVAIFVVLIYLILAYLPSQELLQNDKIILTAAIAIVFLIYEVYFPSTYIETRNGSTSTS